MKLTFKKRSYHTLPTKQQQIRNNLKDIEGNGKILVKVDKSGNLY